MKRCILIFTVLALLLCAGCGGQTPEPTDPSVPANPTEPDGGTAQYAVTVVDDFGNPVTSGVIVNFMTGETVTAMQTVDQNGTASKELPVGTYGIRLDFTDSTDAAYDSNVFLMESQTSVTVKLSGYLASRMLFADGADHTAYFLETGTTNVPVKTDGRTYFLFVPSQTGLYEFSVSEGAVLGYYGAPHFVQNNNLAEMKDGKFTMSFSSGMVGDGGGTVVVLGVDSQKENVSVTITRVGEAEKSIEDYEWTVYKPTVTVDPFVLGDHVTLTEFDLTAATNTYQLVFSEADGFYHLGAEDGPVVYCKLGVNSGYLDALAEVADVSSVSRYFFDDEGNFIKKESYNECLLQYIAFMDEGSGLYPLTQDLYYIIHQRGEYVGWWNPESPSFIYNDDNGNPVVGLNYELAWLSFCCYGEQEEGGSVVPPTEPDPTEPEPTEPEPTEPEPTEPEPTEPEPTEPEPTEPEPTEPEPTEPVFQLGTESSDEAVEVYYYQIASTMSYEATVKAGEYAHYDLFRMFDMILTIESDYAYILYDGEVYLPENGVLTFVLQYGTNDVSSPCSLAIGNFGSADETFELLFSVVPGTHENPVQLSLGQFTTNIPEGAYQGYYYIFTAETDGTLTVTFESIDIAMDCQITLYNLYTYQQNLEVNSSVSITANAGDEIQIIIAVLDEQYEYPAATVIATAVFE